MTASWWGNGPLEGFALTASPDELAREITHRGALLELIAASETGSPADELTILQRIDPLTGLPLAVVAGEWIAGRLRELAAQRAGFDLRGDDVIASVAEITAKLERPGSDMVTLPDGRQVLRYRWPNGQWIACERFQGTDGIRSVWSWEWYRALDEWPMAPSDEDPGEDAPDPLPCYFHNRARAVCGCPSMRRVLHPDMATLLGGDIPTFEREPVPLAAEECERLEARLRAEQTNPDDPPAGGEVPPAGGVLFPDADAPPVGGDPGDSEPTVGRAPSKRRPRRTP